MTEIVRYRLVRYRSGGIGLHETLVSPDGRTYFVSDRPATFDLPGAGFGPLDIRDRLLMAVDDLSRFPVRDAAEAWPDDPMGGGDV